MARHEYREIFIYFALLAGFALLIKGWAQVYVLGQDIDIYKCRATYWQAVARGGEDRPKFTCHHLG